MYIEYKSIADKARVFVCVDFIFIFSTTFLFESIFPRDGFAWFK